MVRSCYLWLYALVFSLGLFVTGLTELMIRRETGPDLYLTNKALASAALLLITFSYVLSAIHHFSNVSSRVLLYRRHTGIVGYGYAVLHIAVSFLVRDPSAPVAYKFPFPDFFVENLWSIGFAGAGFVIFTYVLMYSIRPHRFNGTPQKAKAWRRKLRYGYLGVLLVLLHSVLLKYEGWITWFSSFSPWLPPLSLIITLMVLAMIVLKIMQLTREKRLFQS